MRRTKEDANVTRQQLLNAGLNVFSEKGYAAAKLSEIAEEAGVTRGAIYWHFKNKKELFLALFKDEVDPFFDTIEQTAEEELGPLERIKKIMTLIFNKINNDSRFRASQALELSEKNLQKQIPELKAYMTMRADSLMLVLLKMIVSGMERGEIRQDIEAEVIISMFATLFRGYGFMLSHEDVMPFFRNSDSGQMIEIFIQGIKA